MAPPGQNRLVFEKSPYLQQHADNEVDWYPWGEEAFAKAKAENKPVFLSIGYSTCHWCHVMEEESFLDPTIGDFLNQNFVSIKVDRELRPDVDAIYMRFVQQQTGSGGWPLTVFLTPEGVPFFGGTYFPNPPRYQKIGFLQLIEKIHEAWNADKKELVDHAVMLSERLAQDSQRASASQLPPESVVKKALQYWSGRFDSEYGGFLPAPKFPSPPDLEFLLRYAATKGDLGAEKMVLRTLEAIALGGIRDHLEGGFHRYSTDAEWRVPHFEKMLYDQAQLLSLYSQAYAWTKDPLFKDAAQSTIAYLDSRMRSAEGGFYSAEDADSVIPGQGEDHAEGAFYVWSLAELEAGLTAAELEVVANQYGVTDAGNASAEAKGELAGKNVLYLSEKPAADADKALVEKLRSLRDKRPRPKRDDKILAEWNAMVATGYAEAARYLAQPSYLAEAQGILEFIETNMVVDGTLKRSYLEQTAEVDAFAQDHAQLVGAYLSVFQASGDPLALQRAVHWQAVLDEGFWDDKSGGYFDTKAGDNLLYRSKSRYDGATKSAASCSALNLSALYAITGKKEYADHLESLIKDNAKTLESRPQGLPGALGALLQWYGSHQSLILVSSDPNWKSSVLEVYQPERLVILVGSEESREALKPLIPYLPDWSDQSRAYFCHDFACELPLTKLAEIEKRDSR